AEAHRHVPLDDLEARELERDAKGRSRGAQVGLDEAARETLLAEEDERRLGDRCARDLGALRERMGVVHDADEALRVEGLALEALVLLRQGDDREIDLTVEHAADDRGREAALDRDLDSRMEMAKLVEELRKDVEARRIARADREPSRLERAQVA